MDKKNFVIGVLSVLTVAAGVSYGLVDAHETRNSTVVVSSIMLPRSIAELSVNSYASVVGTVENLEIIREKSSVRPGESDIVTVATIKVDKYLANTRQLDLTTVEVKTLGGKIGEESMISEGGPEFVLGTKVVVFLNKIGENQFSVYGTAQGKFTVNEDGTLGTEKEKPFLNTVFKKDVVVLAELESMITAAVK